MEPPSPFGSRRMVDQVFNSVRRGWRGGSMPVNVGRKANRSVELNKILQVLRPKREQVM
jgi:hypothetical protein